MTIDRNSLNKASERDFPWIRIRINGTPVGAHRLACATCGFQGDVLDNNVKPLPSSVIEKKFRQKGWEVGKNEKHDYCPNCVAKMVAARRAKRRQQGIMSTPPSATVTTLPIASAQPLQDIAMTNAPQPAPMTRDDKRIINIKLHEVYISETEGYATPWTDKTVAESLGVPVAWVAEVRDELYGPAQDNSEIRELLEKVRRVHHDAAAKLDAASTMIADAKAILAKIKPLENEIGEQRRLLESLNAATGRIEKQVAP